MLRLNVTADRTVAVGDPSLAERLVANLVDNALRHNIPSGQVDIVTGLHDGRPTLVVTNTGPVIPPAEIGRLFRPFQRLSGQRTGPGTGLGLSIVQAIAHAHGAVITARPRSGGGLQAEARFPAPPTIRGKPLESPAPANALPTRPLGDSPGS